MIHKKQLGKHEEVLFADFGYGDIRITKARGQDETHESMLIFYNQAPLKEIGSVDSEDSGKTTDEMDCPGFVMSFSNPQSITAIIHSLAELQKQLFLQQNK